jgi:hypothetical protein
MVDLATQIGTSHLRVRKLTGMPHFRIMWQGDPLTGGHVICTRNTLND